MLCKFKYCNLDGGWQGGRYPNGTVYANKTTFPSGIPALANYLHSKQLSFGSYTDRGGSTCDGRVGRRGGTRDSCAHAWRYDLHTCS